MLIITVFLAMSLMNTTQALRISMASAAIAGTKKGAVIVGAGPTGLATAIMLARRGYTDIKVYDRFAAPPSPADATVWSNFEGERLYNIGLSSRGQKALQQLGALEGVRRYVQDVVGRKDWSPGNKAGMPKEELYQGRTFPTRVLQRDRLTGALVEEIQSKYSGAVKVQFNTACINAAWTHEGTDKERCRLTLKDVSTGTPLIFYEEAAFVVGADGTQSAVREAMLRSSPRSKFRVTKFEDKNVRVYRTIPLYFPHDPVNWRRDLNWSVRLKSDINLEALPTKEGVYLGVCIYKPGDKRLTSIRDGRDARAFFEEYFPMYVGCFRQQDLDKFAAKSDNFFPKFSFSGPQLHRGRTVALLGDCIHSVKPFFGLGANSAFEDVTYLDASLEKSGDDVPAALQEYSRQRGKEARAVVEMAHRLDGGFFSFVLPLIVDSILHRALPLVFSPSTLASLNNENRTFSEIQFRKRVDRAIQLSGVFLVIGTVVRKALCALFLYLKSTIAPAYFRFNPI